MSIAYTPTSVSSGYNPTQINANFTAIQTALTRAIDRGVADGANALNQNLDLGTNNIINIGTVVCTDLTIGGISVAAQAAAADASATAAAASEAAAAASAAAALSSENNASASETLASQWATLTGALVAATDYSSKEYAIGTFIRGSVGSAKDWASLTGASPDGSEVSAREWARGTYNVGLTNGGSARMWASLTGSTADDTEYSAKEYAVGTTVAVGSAKQWATEAEDVLVNATEYSAYHWAQKAVAIVGGDQLSIGTGAGTGRRIVNHENTSAATYYQATNSTTGTAGTDGFLLGIDVNEQATLWNYENTDMVFGVNGLEKMRVKASGNISIGASLDNYRLHIHEATSGQNYIQFTNTTTGTTSGDGLVIGFSAAEDARFINYENTNMLFYTNALPRFFISAAGGLYANGATGGDQGLGTINADGAIYVDGQIVTGTAPTTANEFVRVHAWYFTDNTYDTSGRYGVLDFVSTCTEGVMESFGPVGSGADNTDAYLDPLGDMASPAAMLVNVQLTCSANASSNYSGYVNFSLNKASSPSGNGGGTCRGVNGLGSVQTVQNSNTHITPVRSDGTFAAVWGWVGDSSGASAACDILAYAEGEAN